MKRPANRCEVSPARIISAILLSAVLSAGCSAPPAPATPGPPSGAEQPAFLQQTVVAQQSQITTLQDQITALQTSVALRPTAAPTPRPPTIPTVGAIVQGLQVNGTTKGLASAKVVLDEYSDFQ